MMNKATEILNQKSYTRKTKKDQEHDCHVKFYKLEPPYNSIRFVKVSTIYTDDVRMNDEFPDPNMTHMRYETDVFPVDAKGVSLVGSNIDYDGKVTHEHKVVLRDMGYEVEL